MHPFLSCLPVFTANNHVLNKFGMASKQLFKKTRTKPVQLVSSHLKSSQQESSHSNSKQNTCHTLPGESYKVQNLASIKVRTGGHLILVNGSQANRRLPRQQPMPGPVCGGPSRTGYRCLCLAQSVMGLTARATVAFGRL